jgi:cyclic pyranopterin phosphate synthase
VRRGVVDFLKNLHQIPSSEEICLTTNGVLLPELAPALYEAGLRHLNISLDTLRLERYRQITGRDNWQEVIAGLELALSLRFQPLKINCVMLKGINDDELLELALLARDQPLQVRFIELMPTVSQAWWERHFLPMAEVRRRLAELGHLSPVISKTTAGPARIFRVPGFRGELGFISPMSDHHCETCNRLRLTAAGQLRPCLLKALEFDLKGPLRRGLSDQSLSHPFQEAIRFKDEGLSPLLGDTFPTMASIGG